MYFGSFFLGFETQLTGKSIMSVSKNCQNGDADYMFFPGECSGFSSPSQPPLSSQSPAAGQGTQCPHPADTAFGGHVTEWWRRMRKAIYLYDISCKI